MKLKFSFIVLIITFILSLHNHVYAQTAKLNLKVIVSPKIPKTDTLVIMGNQEQFGGWFDFTKGKMTRQNDTTWTLISSFPVNTLLEFQVTRGSWYKTAMYTYGRYSAPKVPFVLKKDTEITIHPANWNDLLNRGITGTVKYHHNFEDNNLKYTRDITVWLPPSYYKTPGKRFPVLYAHDGQNVFTQNSVYNGEWRMDETADSLMRAGKIQEFIIVAINNTKDRWVEYSGTPEGMAYINFIVNNLKPFIDTHYRTKPDKNNTAIIGSSMGGLISFYMVWLHPDVFSKAACLSSGFAYDDGHILDTIAVSRKKIPGTHLYLDCGDQDLDRYFLTANDNMKKLLDKHPEIEVMYKVFKGEPHNEYAWAKRLAIPLTFLFGNNTEH
jgi:enterochelin esterase-like enzyme